MNGNKCTHRIFKPIKAFERLFYKPLTAFFFVMIALLNFSFKGATMTTKSLSQVALALVVGGSAVLFTACGGGECETPDDKKSGCVEKGYHDNGRLAYEIPWKNNEKIVEKWYFESGQLERETPYKNGKIDGVEKTYYKDGQLHEEGSYKNDQRDGISKTYYQNGQIKYDYSFKNGRLDGMVRHYGENGELTRECEYKQHNAVKRIKGNC